MSKWDVPRRKTDKAQALSLTVTSRCGAGAFAMMTEMRDSLQPRRSNADLMLYITMRSTVRPKPITLPPPGRRLG
ncbi:hypothetical protein BAUCODRAFT_34092 [Baudoinia panamericana UAMH 10762]|uniref:Uncharacterized protein n=1 Tax=Baudoinia panamericana (strain UAMH 10762) TaxID=717646 RepID=M2MYM6_BAUPA|nr:uncharacterized protein BAUCODRAFT_34092 [Baudoinia panamericana UAMH 10762]EMC96708.1 hypothetical protein BAUCODRAFT_34092 [Baudoinia panamericana UAMH 10762]